MNETPKIGCPLSSDKKSIKKIKTSRVSLQTQVNKKLKATRSFKELKPKSSSYIMR